MDKFVLEILRVSERAANISRLCRREQALFELLVEEKTGEAKNKRFLRDFKTLADVLIQETVKYYLGRQFPCLSGHIFGEESNQFTNTLGESITVVVCPSEVETAQLLARVLGGEDTPARLLAKAVHGEVPSPMIPPELGESLRRIAVDVTQLGIWIDPIDCTNEYIAGKTVEPLTCGTYTHGLQCVTVLIGAFIRSTGEPVMGVVNQPFWSDESRTWIGRVVWGVAYGSLCVSNITSMEGPTRRIMTSSSTPWKLVSALTKEGWEILSVTGAGYKLLCVIDGLCDAYLLTSSLTFKWDTCGPHAILKSLGGNVVSWQKSLCSGKVVEENELRYDRPDDPSLSEGQKWRNCGGLIAYRRQTLAQEILDTGCSESVT